MSNTKNKKDCYEILVNSEWYNEDKEYQNQINNQLTQMFKSFGETIE